MLASWELVDSKNVEVGLLAVTIAMAVLVASLLTAIVRPLWYDRLLTRFGVFKSARPNDMVPAGIGRTFQNIRLFQNMTVARERAGRHARQAAQQPARRAHLVAGVRPRGGAARGRARELLALVGLRGRDDVTGHATCPTATSGGWRSPGRWRATRCCCCWTSRPPA